MKKQRTQLLILFLGLYLIGITLSSCEAEKSFGNNNRMIVKRCSMKDAYLQSDIKLKQAVNQLKNIKANSLHSNANARLIYDDVSGLFYDDEKGIYVSKDGKESYTFPVFQPNPNDKIKNITFNKNSSGGYDVYIVCYGYTKEDVSIYSKETLTQYQIEYVPLIKENVVYSENKRWIICVDTYEWRDSPLDEGELTGNFGYTWVLVSSECESGGSVGPDYEHIAGNGTTNSGGDGNVGGPSGGGPVDGTNPPPTNLPTTNSPPVKPDDTILTATVLDSDQQNNPCVELKSKSMQILFKNKLNYLKQSNILTADHETGFTENRTSTGASNYVNATASPNTHKITIPGMALGYAHVHQDNYILNGVEITNIKMFSPADILALADTCLNYATSIGLTASDTYGIMVSSEGTYALKMLTPTINITTEQSYWDEFTREYTRQATDLMSEGDLNPTNIKIIFLNLLKVKGFYNNIGLYRATNDDFTEWSRVVLDGTTPHEQPCNN